MPNSLTYINLINCILWYFCNEIPLRNTITCYNNYNKPQLRFFLTNFDRLSEKTHGLWLRKEILSVGLQITF